MGNGRRWRDAIELNDGQSILVEFCCFFGFLVIPDSVIGRNKIIFIWATLWTRIRIRWRRAGRRKSRQEYYVFDDIDDICWAWEKLFTNVLDTHAPLKNTKSKASSEQSKFITPEIRKAIRNRNALKNGGKLGGVQDRKKSRCSYATRIS